MTERRRTQLAAFALSIALFAGAAGEAHAEALTCETFAKTLPSGESHACASECYGNECRLACEANPHDETCNQLCSNYGGLSFCRDRCKANSDLSCLPEYFDKDAVCPAFGGPMWRLGARAQVGAIFGATAGPLVGGILVVGRRISSEWAFITKFPLILGGYDERKSYLLGAGFELGAERSFVDAFFDNSMVNWEMSIGVWAPSFFVEPPFLLAPMASSGLTLLFFDWSDEPAYGPYRSNLSVGIEGGGGYAPSAEQGVFRAALTLGIDLAAY